MTETPQQRIAYEMKLKKEDADAGKIEAFFSVDIQRTESGKPVPTVTIICDKPGAEKYQDVMNDLLWQIAQMLKCIF